MLQLLSVQMTEYVAVTPLLTSPTLQQHYIMLHENGLPETLPSYHH